MVDGKFTYQSPVFGGGGGSSEFWQVFPVDQKITQVEFGSGEVIYSLTFITNKGNKSPKFGGKGGAQYAQYLQIFPDGQRIVGLYRRHGLFIDKLGFILEKTIK